MKRRSPSLLRGAHGNGRDALIRVEVPPIDELVPLNAEDTELGLVVCQRRGRPFQRGNTAASGRKPAMARLGVEVPAGTDARYKAALRAAKRYVDRRCRELAVMHGGTLGAGPSAVLASAGLALAASRYVYALAAESGDPTMFKQAASLADHARTAELTAVALAEREAQAIIEDPADVVRRERLLTGKRK